MDSLRATTSATAIQGWYFFVCFIAISISGALLAVYGQVAPQKGTWMGVLFIVALVSQFLIISYRSVKQLALPDVSAAPGSRQARGQDRAYEGFNYRGSRLGGPEAQAREKMREELLSRGSSTLRTMARWVLWVLYFGGILLFNQQFQFVDIGFLLAAVFISLASQLGQFLLSAIIIGFTFGTYVVFGLNPDQPGIAAWILFGSLLYAGGIIGALVTYHQIESRSKSSLAYIVYHLGIPFMVIAILLFNFVDGISIRVPHQSDQDLDVEAAFQNLGIAPINPPTGDLGQIFSKYGFSGIGAGLKKLNIDLGIRFRGENKSLQGSGSSAQTPAEVAYALRSFSKMRENVLEDIEQDFRGGSYDGSESPETMEQNRQKIEETKKQLEDLLSKMKGNIDKNQALPPLTPKDRKLIKDAMEQMDRISQKPERIGKSRTKSEEKSLEIMNKIGKGKVSIEPSQPLLSESMLKSLKEWLKRIAIVLGVGWIVYFVGELLKKRKASDLDVLKQSRKKLSRAQKKSLKTKLKQLDQMKLSPREEVIKKYGFFLDLMEAFDRGKPIGDPPYIYYGNLKQSLPYLDQVFKGITTTFIEVFYGEVNPNQERLDFFRSRFDKLISSLL